MANSQNTKKIPKVKDSKYKVIAINNFNPDFYKDQNAIVALTIDKNGDHARLDTANELFINALSPFRLVRRWVPEELAINTVKVTCRVSHVEGNTERVLMMASTDNSKGKNFVKTIGAPVSYLMRYTLFAICGLSTSDMADTKVVIPELKRTIRT